MAKAAMQTQGMSKGQLQRAIIANAVRVFNAGGLALRPAGITIGEVFKKHVETMYSRSGSGTKHKGLPSRSSLPGEPPAKQYGELLSSVKFNVSRKPGRAAATGKFVKGFGKTEIKIYTKNPYAAALEFGTSGKGKKIAKRPAWKPIHDLFAAHSKRLIAVPIMYGQPMNFVKAERKAAAALKLSSALSRNVLGRETAAGR